MSLAGRHILVCRPQAQSQRLLQLLQQHQAIPLHFPIIEIDTIPDALVQLPLQVAQVNWLVFISPTAIDTAWPVLAGYLLPGHKLACVGASSAKKLSRLAARPVLYPLQGSDSDALLALPELSDLTGNTALIIRGKGGKTLLGDTLLQRGARVAYADIYQRVDGQPDWPHFDQQPPDAIVLTSSEMVTRMFDLAGSARKAALQCQLYCVPHPRIAQTLMQYGVTRIVTTRADDDALVTGLNEWFDSHP